jgi:hypothetical protein
VTARDRRVRGARGPRAEARRARPPACRPTQGEPPGRQVRLPASRPAPPEHGRPGLAAPQPSRPPGGDGKAPGGGSPAGGGSKVRARPARCSSRSERGGPGPRSPRASSPRAARDEGSTREDGCVAVATVARSPRLVHPSPDRRPASARGPAQTGPEPPARLPRLRVDRVQRLEVRGASPARVAGARAGPAQGQAAEEPARDRVPEPPEAPPAPGAAAPERRAQEAATAGRRTSRPLLSALRDGRTAGRAPVSRRARARRSPGLPRRRLHAARGAAPGG